MAVNVGATGEDGTFYGGSHIWNNTGGDGTRLHLDPYEYHSYKGESGTGGWKDMSYEKNHLSTVGDAGQRGTGTNYGRAYFGGTNDFAYITDASMSDLDIGSSNFCVQYWVYPGLNATQYHIHKGSSTGYRMYASSNYLRLYVGSTLCTYYNWGDPRNEWHNIAFVCTRGSAAILYLDGVNVNGQYSSNTVPTTSLNNSNSFIIGGYSTSTTPTTVTSDFKGAFGPVIFYKDSTVLTEDAVRQNFNVHRGIFGK